MVVSTLMIDNYNTTTIIKDIIDLYITAQGVGSPIPQYLLGEPKYPGISHPQSLATSLVAVHELGRLGLTFIYFRFFHISNAVSRILPNQS